MNVWVTAKQITTNNNKKIWKIFTIQYNWYNKLYIDCDVHIYIWKYCWECCTRNVTWCLFFSISSPWLKVSTAFFCHFRSQKGQNWTFLPKRVEWVGERVGKISSSAFWKFSFWRKLLSRRYICISFIWGKIKKNPDANLNKKNIFTVVHLVIKCVFVFQYMYFYCLTSKLINF